MKKILFIFNGYATKKSGLSGGEKHSLALANHLYIKKYNIFICCPQKYYNLRRIRGAKFLVYPSIPFEEKMYSILPILFFIYWYRIFISMFKVHNLRPSVIITNSHLFHDIIPTFFIDKNLIFITYIHHIIAEQNRGGFSSLITKFLEKISFYIIKKRNFIAFVDSKRTKITLVNKYNFCNGNIHITKNGIDLNYIKSIRTDHKTVYDLCFCGRLSKQKGVFDLIEIVKRVKKYYPKILCVIIGEGKEKNNIVREIKWSGLENNFRLLGFLSEKEKITTMKSSKLFILPSHEEGWGIVIGEAMACGLPVIVYKLKDIVKIWKDNVIWVNCFNLNEFSHQIIRLLKNDKLEKDMIQRGYALAETLDWYDIVKHEWSIISLKMKN